MVNGKRIAQLGFNTIGPNIVQELLAGSLSTLFIKVSFQLNKFRGDLFSNRLTGRITFPQRESANLRIHQDTHKHFLGTGHPMTPGKILFKDIHFVSGQPLFNHLEIPRHRIIPKTHIPINRLFAFVRLQTHDRVNFGQLHNISGTRFLNADSPNLGLELEQIGDLPVRHVSPHLWIVILQDIGVQIVIIGRA